MKESIEIAQSQTKAENIKFNNYVLLANTEPNNYYNNFSLIDYHRLEIQVEYTKLFADFYPNFDKLFRLFNKYQSTQSKSALNKFISIYLSTLSLNIKRLCNSSFLQQAESIRGKDCDISLVHILSGDKFVASVTKMYDTNHKEKTAHDACIGILLNRLANKTPNFIYFFGLVPCNTIACEKDDNVGYALFEFVIGKTLQQWITEEKRTDYDIQNIIIQILFSLYIASSIEFTHYELDMSNVMIVELEDYQEFQYNINGKYYNLSIKYLAKIIDYKYASASVFHSSEANIEKGNRRNYSPQNDIVKFLSHILPYVTDEETKIFCINTLNSYMYYDEQLLPKFIELGAPYYNDSTETNLYIDGLLGIFEEKERIDGIRVENILREVMEESKINIENIC